MPTKDQCQELIDNTTSTWTTINGVNGRKFINKSDSNKYIFLPAGGCYADTTYDDVGSYGFYWITVYNTEFRCNTLTFNSSSIYINDLSQRRFGSSIRSIRSVR